MMHQDRSPLNTTLPLEPLVSVVVPTYGHAPYIAECLTSILAQQFNAPWEILIGEDGGTDGTREICEQFVRAHPDRIRLMVRDRKDVIPIMGQPTGRSK
ncbi:MAG: glycosyltransferase family 2 protein [Flavobacteriales bacterium]|nr:glycosyltransferase family 2 protein [Flavobacteriales bacterium]